MTSSRRGRVVVCLDKFRGSLTAAEACAAIGEGLVAGRPLLDVCSFPVADGGEGTIEAMLTAGYDRVDVAARGPLGQEVQAVIAVRRRRAVIELAQAAGRQLRGPQDALRASTYGVGQLLRAALDHGCRELILAVGGSATTDGGAGMLGALGARLLDAAGAPLRPGGAELAHLARLDLSEIDPRLKESRIVLASDVDNPLLGGRGAAEVYGPQKGARPADVRALEAGLARFAEEVERVTGCDLASAPGAGAAGGTGFAALVLGARRKPGIDVVLDELDVVGALRSADLVVTGEGRMDYQTLQGKAPLGVARLARRSGVPAVGVAGQVLLDDAGLRRLGVLAAYSLTDRARDEEHAMRDAAALLRELGVTIAMRHLH